MGEANVARGKPYTLKPTPNYPHCTDPGDSRQLTDGRTTGANWLKKSTVGWSYPKSQPTVVIDLGQIEPIDQVRIHSVGGGKAGVFYPASILVLVSDDNRFFHVAGSTDNLGLAQQRFNTHAAPAKPHVFEAENLRTRGRFVLVLLETDGAYLFADEIEVLRGTHDPQQVRFAAGNRFRPTETAKLLRLLHARRGLSLVQNWLQDAAEQEADTPERTPKQRLAELAVDAEAAYSQAEIGGLIEDLYAVRARRLEARHQSRLTWTIANPMEQIPPTAIVPKAAPHAETLSLRCWRGEYESAAITLVNNGAWPLRLKVLVSSLRSPDGASHAARDCFSLRQAVFVHSRPLGPIADALVKLSDDDLSLLPGRAGQLWLTFHNPALPAAEYRFDVRIAATNEHTPGTAAVEFTIPGRLRVDPLDFPTQPTLRTFNWSYIRHARATRHVAHEALSDLRAHYVNVFVLHPKEIPAPQRGPDGQIRVDFNTHAEALRLYEGAAQLLFFWGLSPAHPDFPGLPPRLSPQWKKLMGAWLHEWVNFLQRFGLGYEDFAMYPFDEYIGDEMYELARFIKEEVDPRIRIFANARGDKSGKQIERLAPYVDIWCFPDVPAGYRVRRHERRVREKLSPWTYACLGPAKGHPPYAYYRLQMWRAFARGDAGCGFWIYSSRNEAGEAIWNDIPAHAGPYDVVYSEQGAPVDVAGEKLIPSRRWEAWREGVEDYEYLVQLQTAVQKARQAGRVEAAAQGRRILERSVADVLANQGAADTVYRVRQDITEAILRLSRGN